MTSLSRFAAGSAAAPRRGTCSHSRAPRTVGAPGSPCHGKNDPTLQISTLTVIGGALDELIARLITAPTAPDHAEKLGEARRLRKIIETWQAGPPTDESKADIMRQAMDLIASVRSEGER